MTKEKQSQEFIERSKLQEKERELTKFKHECKMEALAFDRETQKRFFENQMAFHRLRRSDKRHEHVREEEINRGKFGQ